MCACARACVCARVCVTGRASGGRVCVCVRASERQSVFQRSGVSASILFIKWGGGGEYV